MPLLSEARTETSMRPIGGFLNALSSSTITLAASTPMHYGSTWPLLSSAVSTATGEAYADLTSVPPFGDIR